MSEGTRAPLGARWLVLAAVGGALAVIGVAALLTNIFQKQQEARNPFYRVVALNDTIDDPAVWGQNFPLQFDYRQGTMSILDAGQASELGAPKWRALDLQYDGKGPLVTLVAVAALAAVAALRER